MPFAVAAVLYGGYTVSHTPRGQAALAEIGARALTASAAMGLVVSDIEVEGRKTTDATTIMAALGAARGTPIFAVSPPRAREQLEKLPWVRSAAIERRLPGTIFVRLIERQPLAVWQHDGRQELIDRQGAVIPVKDLSRFAQLPTVVGPDANIGAAGLLEMLRHEPDLAARVTAAVRVDDRRWNLRLDHAVDVLLPEENPAAAWSRLAALERSQRLLQREVAAVDMRMPDRLVLRTVGEPPKDDAAPAKKARPGKAT